MAPTQPALEFQYRASRIASFTEGTKLGNTKSLKFWTNSSLSPDHLADCGFHYTPTKTYPDQVTCFWCGKKERNLDNVECLSEYHLKNWPKCPYSRIVSNLEHFVKDSEKERFWLRLRDQDAPISVTEPHSMSSISLRLATFKNLWKFDNKRRSKVKVTSRGLAEAGFYYSPVDQDDDRVICMYCDCPLSDWVLDDDPMVEHEKNSFVFCYFLHTLKKSKETQSPREEEKITSPIVELGENISFSEGDSRSKVVPDIDLNGEPVNDSDDINSSAPSIAELKPQTSFDMFDFSIEDLERNDKATIFHGQDILPRKFTRKRRQDLHDEQQKKRIASEKHSSFTSDKSTSLALKVREESDNEDPQISIEDVVDYEHEETSNLSVIQSTLISSTSDHEVLDPEDGDYTESSVTGADLIESDKSPHGRSISNPKKPSVQSQSKKKSKSQFSDDEFDLNSHDLDAILNSPKKGRKMKVLKQDDALLLPADIYNLSNQNIGDYDEQNLAYLEGNTRRKNTKRIPSKSATTPQQLVPLKSELKEISKPSNSANNTILDDSEIHTPNQLLESSKPIEIDQYSQQNSPRKSDITAIGLVPQSSPKDASLNSEKAADRQLSRESVDRTQDMENDLVLSSKFENADSSLDLSKVSKNGKDVNHNVCPEADIEMLPSSGSPQANPATEIPAETASDLLEINDETETTETALEGGVDYHIDQKADLSKEIVEHSDEVESSHENPVAISSSRPSSRESDDKVGDFNVSPSSYEEYKKELQMMESELIETSSPPLSEDLGEDSNQIPDTGMEVSSPKDSPKEVKLETVPQKPLGNDISEKVLADDISRIDESASEDPQLLPINTSLLEGDESIDPPKLDPVEDSSTESGNEEEIAEEPAKLVEESCERRVEELQESRVEEPRENRGEELQENRIEEPRDNTVEPSPQATETSKHEEKTREESNVHSSPAGFLTKVVERVKAISPSRNNISPNKTKESKDSHHKEIEGKSLDKPSFLGMEASTPEKKSHIESKGTLPTVLLEKALQEIQVLEETIEYLAEVSATDQELHNDMDGVLTEFIAAMPEEEEAMSISEWIVHNASTCRRTIEEAAQNIIQGYVEEFDKVIAHVEQLDTID